MKTRETLTDARVGEEWSQRITTRVTSGLALEVTRIEGGNED